MCPYLHRRLNTHTLTHMDKVRWRELEEGSLHGSLTSTCMPYTYIYIQTNTWHTISHSWLWEGVSSQRCLHMVHGSLWPLLCLSRAFGLLSFLLLLNCCRNGLGYPPQTSHALGLTAASLLRRLTWRFILCKPSLCLESQLQPASALVGS